MAGQARSRILLVDDEANVLEGLRRHLRLQFDVTVANGPQAALQFVGSEGPFEAVVSDLQMPMMNGVTLLTSIRKISPDTVRMLLTGHADIDAAIAAVNEGNIFRFLSKPCPPSTLVRTLEAAVEQYRLITSERVLLEQTLRGSLKTLTDILAFVNPVAFGRAIRTRKAIGKLAHLQGMADPWVAEIAAMLAPIGWVTLPAETSNKLYRGEELSPPEKVQVGNLSVVTEQLLGNIPRLELVREILRHKDQRYDDPEASYVKVSGNAIPWGARALKAITDFDVLECRGFSPELALKALRARIGWYDPAIMKGLERLQGGVAVETKVRQIHLSEVVAGMTFADDVKNSMGLLLIARGQEVTPSLVERIRHMATVSKIDAPVLVIVPPPPVTPPGAEAAGIPSEHP